MADFPLSWPRVRLCVSDLGGFDDEGRMLLHDWTLAVLKA